jgi:5-formyltetrahydrofolate cyclo-ligase
MDKQTIRESIWRRMEDLGVALFPGARGRIPNFTGATEAAAALAGSEAWEGAEVLKCNPDAPQRQVRFRALKAGKRVFMAVPRLRELECFVELDPRRIGTRKLYDASSIEGAFRHGRPLHPRDMPRIDLVVAGSVAVNKQGQRIGKGGGYSDLEWALGRELGYITAATVVATTVHPVQLVRGRLPVRRHDLTVDLIALPGGMIEVTPRPRKPAGVDRGLVTETMRSEIPILAELLGKSGGDRLHDADAR